MGQQPSQTDTQIPQSLFPLVPQSIGDRIPLDSQKFPRSTTIVQSPDGKNKLIYQDDGNLVYYANSSVPSTKMPSGESIVGAYASRTTGIPSDIFVLGTDGELYIVQSDGISASTIWTTRNILPFSGRRPYFLVAQDDGNLVIYDSDGAPQADVAGWTGKSFLTKEAIVTPAVPPAQCVSYSSIKSDLQSKNARLSTIDSQLRAIEAKILEFDRQTSTVTPVGQQLEDEKSKFNNYIQQLSRIMQAYGVQPTYESVSAKVREFRNIYSPYTNCSRYPRFCTTYDNWIQSNLKPIEDYFTRSLAKQQSLQEQISLRQQRDDLVNEKVKIQNEIVSLTSLVNSLRPICEK